MKQRHLSHLGVAQCLPTKTAMHVFCWDRTLWLERPLGVREAGVRSPTAAHQIHKSWKVCDCQLGTNELDNRLSDSDPYNGLSDSFLFTCGRIKSVAWHPKTVGHRSVGPKRQVQANSPHLHRSTPAYTTASNLQSVI